MSGKIVAVSAMHQRQETVKYCLDKMPFLDFLYTYSLSDDADFLKAFNNVKGIYYSQNLPLSVKWGIAIKSLLDVDFDCAIILGSDDYVCENYLDFVIEKTKTYNHIGAIDIYFEEKNNFYYWSGYENHRKGEPIGAGKVYTKSLLEKMSYDIFRNAGNDGLDGMAWKLTNKYTLPYTFSIRQHSLKLVDVKDGKGINQDISRYKTQLIEGLV